MVSDDILNISTRWIDFLKEHKDKGYNMTELSAMYRKRYNLSEIKDLKELRKAMQKHIISGFTDKTLYKCIKQNRENCKKRDICIYEKGICKRKPYYDINVNEFNVTTQKDLPKYTYNYIESKDKFIEPSDILRRRN